jgi:hypothetical protein
MGTVRKRTKLAAGKWGSVSVVKLFDTSKDEESGEFSISASVCVEVRITGSKKAHLVPLWKDRWTKGVVYNKALAAERFDRLSEIAESTLESKFKSFVSDLKKR